jgi:hypothetical protein
MESVPLIVTALAAGAAAEGAGTGAQAVKDAYEGLKQLVNARLAGMPGAELVLVGHEEAPGAWRERLITVLEQAGADRDSGLAVAAVDLVRLAAEAGSWTGVLMADAQGAKGLQIGNNNTQVNVQGNLTWIDRNAQGPAQAALSGSRQERDSLYQLQLMSSAELSCSLDDADGYFALSPDGQRIAARVSSVNPDSGLVAIWDISTGTELIRIEHSSHVTGVEFSSDGKQLLTVSEGAACVWDSSSGKLKDRLKSGKPIEYAVFSPDGRMVAMVASDSLVDRVRVVDIASHSKIWSAEVLCAQDVAYHPNGKYLAVATLFGEAIILDITMPGDEEDAVRKVSHPKSKKNWVESVRFSPDGQRLATASADHTARIWDAGTGKEIVSILHRRRVDSVVFSPNGQWLATVAQEKMARIWDPFTGAELLRIKVQDEVFQVAFTPDGTMLAIALMSVKEVGIQFYRIAH